MKTNRFWLIAMTALSMLTVACSSGDDNMEDAVIVPETPEEPATPEVPAEPTVVVPKARVDIKMTPKESLVNDAANQFSLKFFREMVNDPNAGPNIFVSPFSAQAVLSMVANGARGETLNQMLNALNMQDFGLDAINQYNKTIIKAIADLDNTTYITSANGIWSKLDLLESFCSKMQEIYDAKIEKTDFSREALIAINNWAKEQTHGMIPELYNVNEEVNPLLRMVLANALYFNAVWNEPFSKELTTKDAFTNADKSTSSIDIMYGGSRTFLECETFDMCVKSYGNGAFSMVFLLPHQGVALSKSIDELAQKDWKVLTANLTKSYRSVYLRVPKFELKGLSYDLKPALSALGMQLPFTDLADFQNMTNKGSLCIGKVDQKTALMLNEQGTQAAAITKVEMWASSNGTEPEPVDFIINRPFAFLIKENSTGVILFAGAVNKL